MSVPRRWLRFNIVGVIGFGVQLATLSLLLQVTKVPHTLAVVLAVLVAVSHNFMWHEHVTWRSGPRADRWRRWVGFNLSNGAVSLLTNVVVTNGLIAAADISAIAANVVAVLLASLANFIVSERIVFKPSGPGRALA